MLRLTRYLRQSVFEVTLKDFPLVNSRISCHPARLMACVSVTFPLLRFPTEMVGVKLLVGCHAFVTYAFVTATKLALSLSLS